MSATATRRAALAAFAGSVAFAGTIGAAIAAPAAAARITDEPEGDRFEAGRREGEEIALLHVARAFIDRWRAAGGDFGLMLKPESEPCVMFGVAESYVWEPTDHDRTDLAPHVLLTEAEHQAGAIKVLEALLILVPGLQATVRGIVGVQLLAAREA